MNSTASLNHHLQALLPTWTAAALPQPLVDLAASFYAQSRGRASALKPEEEIGRAYACAQLAAERLKQRLNLPTIESRPPCAPRVYKKLYQYLEQALFLPPTTPKKNRINVNVTPTKTGSGHASRHIATPLDLTTPSQRMGGQVQTPTVGRKRKFEDYAASGDIGGDEVVPPWVASAVRHLCRELDAPDAVAHVYVGIATILGSTTLFLEKPSQSKRSSTPRSGKAKTEEAFADQRIMVLVIGTLCEVIQRLSGRPVDKEQKVAAVQALFEHRGSSRNAKDQVHMLKDVERMLTEEGASWRELEWWRNIPQSADVEMENTISDEQDSDFTLDPVREAPKLLRQLGSTQLHGPLQGKPSSMMQVDWLSEERRLDYIKWKAKIMERIERKEREIVYVTSRV